MELCVQAAASAAATNGSNNNQKQQQQQKQQPMEVEEEEDDDIIEIPVTVGLGWGVMKFNLQTIDQLRKEIKRLISKIFGGSFSVNLVL